jgi:hypothetical protein
MAFALVRALAAVPDPQDALRELGTPWHPAD